VTEVFKFHRSDSKESKYEAGGFNSIEKFTNLMKYENNSKFLDQRIDFVEGRLNEQYSELEDTLYQGNTLSYNYD